MVVGYDRDALLQGFICALNKSLGSNSDIFNYDADFIAEHLYKIAKKEVEYCRMDYFEGE